MKVLEPRRHSHCKHGGGSQLSQEGVDLARRIAPCEGARLIFEGELERFTRIEFLRHEAV